MARRFTGLLAVPALCLALLATACSSSPATTAKPSAAESLGALLNRERQLTAPFVQCLAANNIPIWDKSQGNQSIASLGTQGGWYANSKILDNTAFTEAFEEIEGTYPIGAAFTPQMMVADWITRAASTGKWPSVCGPLPRAK